MLHRTLMLSRLHCTTAAATTTAASSVSSSSQPPSPASSSISTSVSTSVSSSSSSSSSLAAASIVSNFSSAASRLRITPPLAPIPVSSSSSIQQQAQLQEKEDLNSLDQFVLPPSRSSASSCSFSPYLYSAQLSSSSTTKTSMLPYGIAPMLSNSTRAFSLTLPLLQSSNNNNNSTSGGDNNNNSQDEVNSIISSKFPRRNFRGTVTENCSDLSFAQQVIELKRRYRGTSRNSDSVADAVAVYSRCVPSDPKELQAWLNEENATLFLNGARFFGLLSMHTEVTAEFATQIRTVEDYLVENLASFKDSYYFVQGALTTMQLRFRHARAEGEEAAAEASQAMSAKRDEMINKKIVPRVLRELALVGDEAVYTMPMLEQALKLLLWCESTSKENAQVWNQVADIVRKRENEIGQRLQTMVSVVYPLAISVPSHEVVKDLMDTLFTGVAAMRSFELATFCVAVEHYFSTDHSLVSAQQIKELIGRFGSKVGFNSAEDLRRAFPCLARIALSFSSSSSKNKAESDDVRDLMQMVLDHNEAQVVAFMDPAYRSSGIYCDGAPDDVARIVFAYESFGRNSSTSSALFRSFRDYILREFDDMTLHCAPLALGILSRTNCLTSELAEQCSEFILENAEFGQPQQQQNEKKKNTTSASAANKKKQDAKNKKKKSSKQQDEDEEDDLTRKNNNNNKKGGGGGTYAEGFLTLEEAGYCLLALVPFASPSSTSSQSALCSSRLQEHILGLWEDAVAGKKFGDTRVPLMGFSDHAHSNAAVTSAVAIASSTSSSSPEVLKKLLLNSNHQDKLLSQMRGYQIVQMWNASLKAKGSTSSTSSTSAAASSLASTATPTKLNLVQAALFNELKKRLVANSLSAVDLRLLCSTSVKNLNLSRELQHCINNVHLAQDQSQWSSTTLDLLKYSSKLDKSSYAEKAVQTALSLAVSGSQFIHFYSVLAEAFPENEAVRSFGKRGTLQLLKHDRFSAFAFIDLLRGVKAVSSSGSSSSVGAGVSAMLQKLDPEFLSSLLRIVLPTSKSLTFTQIANSIALVASYSPNLEEEEDKKLIVRLVGNALKQISPASSDGFVYSAHFSARELLRDLFRGADSLCRASFDSANPVGNYKDNLAKVVAKTGLRAEDVKGTVFENAVKEAIANAPSASSSSAESDSSSSTTSGILKKASSPTTSMKKSVSFPSSSSEGSGSLSPTSSSGNLSAKKSTSSSSSKATADSKSNKKKPMKSTPAKKSSSSSSKKKADEKSAKKKKKK